MKEEEGHIDLFERYRNGDLLEAELKDFEARLVYDADFKKAYEDYLTMESGIKSHFRNELKYKLIEVDHKMDEPSGKFNYVKLLIWSTSIAAVVTIGIFFFQHFSKPNYTQIAQQYWPYEEGLPVKMSSQGKYDEAMNAFKLGNWDEAESILKEIESDTASYFLGVVHYEQKELEKAAECFSKIDENSSYYNEAQFRLALTTLLLDKDIGEKMLQEIDKSDSLYSLNAHEVLKKL